MKLNIVLHSKAFIRTRMISVMMFMGVGVEGMGGEGANCLSLSKAAPDCTDNQVNEYGKKKSLGCKVPYFY